MKWFQVDSDTPNDPKVKVVLREMGAAGVGGLFLLWCHIADHGAKKPGWSIDSFGRPMPEQELMIASELNRDDFLKLVTICTGTGHFVAKQWERKHVIAIPAMAARADTYTKRVVRTLVEPTSKKVRQSSSTTQDSTRQKEPPVVPLSGGRVTQKEHRQAAELRKQAYGRCPHEPKCPTYAECLTTIAVARRA